MNIRKAETAMSEEARIAVLENTMQHIYEALERLDRRFDAIEKRFEAIDRRFEMIDKRFEKIENNMHEGFRDINNRLWSNFLWTIAGFAGVLSLLAHLLHWI